MSEKRLLLLDGHSLAYRAFYALPVENFVTANGQHTNAVYGLASMLINLITSEKPTHIAVAFDVSRKTFRSEKFADYKANRSSSPDEFKSQSEYIFKLMDAFNIKRFALEGFEADDLIATLAKSAEKKGFQTLICTGDRDAFQLINESTTVLYPKKGVADLARMTPEAVVEKYGLTPKQYPDFAALRGDPSDNLPSIPGVGEKTAAKWVVEYGSFENVIKHASEISGKVGESLRANLKHVLLNHELTHLRSDVKIETNIDNLSWAGINSQETKELFDLLEIKALKDRLKNLTGESEPIKAIPKTQNKKTTIKNFDEIDGIITSPVAVDLEYQEGKILSYAIALQNGDSYLVKSDRFGSWLSDSKIQKYMHNSKKYLHRQVIEGIVFDTELAAYLINPGTRSLSLNDLSEKYLGESLGNADELFSDFSTVGAESILKLVPILQKELAEREMEKLFLDLEMPILEILGKMERNGIAVDKDALLKEVEYFNAIVQSETKSAYSCAGHEFNVNSPKQLQAILFDSLSSFQKTILFRTRNPLRIEYIHSKLNLSFYGNLWLLPRHP